MFMLTALEKERILENVDRYTDAFYHDTDTKLLIKVVSNFVQMYVPNIGVAMDESMFTDKRVFKNNLDAIIKAMLNAQAKTRLKTYTTGDLAKFFGVSVTTINNWIDQNRFVGVARKEKNEKVRISENTIWISSSNQLIPVSVIVEDWENEQKKYGIPSDKEDMAVMKQTIKYFEEKYGGRYEDTLFKLKSKSPEQLRDEDEWKYLLGRVKND